MQNKTNKTVIIYISLLVITVISGILGNTNAESLSYAHKYFSNEEILSGRLNFLFSMLPFSLYSVLRIIFLAAVIRGFIWDRFSRFLERGNFPDSINIFISVIFLLSIFTVIQIPFNIFAGYYRGICFGLIRTDFLTWFSRYSVSAVISIFSTAVLISLIVIVIKKTRKYCFYIPVIFFIFSVMYTILYPRFITPIFYETVEIKNPALEQSILKMSEKAGVEIKDIQVINKSRYSSALNAYLIGIGTERKIVLYDTLLEKFSNDQILAILAHEMGHYTEEHMFIGLLLASLGILAALPLFVLLSKFLFGKGLVELLREGKYPHFLLILILILFAAKPVKNSISRYMEYRADKFSLEITEKPDVFISMKVNLAKTNHSYLLPHPLYRWFYYTHPTILERIRNAENYLP